MTRRVAFLLALLALAAGGADRRPHAVIAREGALTITLPADVLTSAEVKRQLTSGLTTAFVVTAECEGAKGAAKVDVRYELWEEKYLVTLTDITGHERTLSFDSEAALARWWSENPLVAMPTRSYGPRADVQVKLKVLPFSSREQSDTQRWLARSLSASQSAAGEGSSPRSAEILRIIVETSIQRRPLLEYKWSVRAEREAAR